MAQPLGKAGSKDRSLTSYRTYKNTISEVVPKATIKRQIYIKWQFNNTDSTDGVSHLHGGYR